MTGHAIARFLERALNVPVIDAIDGCGNAGAMLRHVGMSKAEAIELMWPEDFPLYGDPGGVFAIKRGNCRCVVRDGKMVTVLFGAWWPTKDSAEVANQVMA